MMVAPPFPEERADLGDIAAAADVFDGLVVDGDGHRGGHRPSGEVADAQADAGGLAGLELLRRRQHLDVQDALLGGHDQLAGDGMHLAVGDGHRLDKHVRHVAQADLEGQFRALAFQARHHGRRADAVGRAHKEQHRAAVSVGVDHQVGGVARGVFGPVVDQLQVVEAEVALGKAGAGDIEQVAALDGAALGVGHRKAQPVLAGLGGGQDLAGIALRVRLQRPALGLDLAGQPVRAVADGEQPEQALAGDRLAVDGARREGGDHRVPGPIVAAVDPAEDAERLAGGDDAAGAGDGPARGVDHLGGDLVAVVAASVQGLGDASVDGHRDRAVRADGDLVLGDQLGRSGALRPPPGRRRDAAPMPPARIPVVVRGMPPVAGAVEPVPGADRIPVRVMHRAPHRVAHLGLGHRRPEVVRRLDGRGDHVAKLDRLRRRLDGHLVFRLLVLLDAERAAAARTGQEELVHAQGRVLRQRVLAVESAERIGRE